MMIHLFFILTIVSGLLQEFNSLWAIVKGTDQNTSPKMVTITYSIGALFFLFWREPFITWQLIAMLNVFAIIDIFSSKNIRRINVGLCIITLVLLIVNYINYIK